MKSRTAAGRPGSAQPHAPPSRGIVLVGAHGGAGVTTLAALLRPAWDMGALRPADQGRLQAAGRPVVLVTCSTVTAAGRAVAAASVLGEQGIPLAVLAVVGDGLPEPAEACYRFRLLQARMTVVRVPFIPAFRIAADPLRVNLPRRARQALTEIRAITG